MSKSFPIEKVVTDLRHQLTKMINKTSIDDNNNNYSAARVTQQPPPPLCLNEQSKQLLTKLFILSLMVLITALDSCSGLSVLGIAVSKVKIRIKNFK